MTTNNGSIDDAAGLVTRLSKLLDMLLEPSERIYYSDQSLNGLLRFFAGELEKAIAEGTQQELLDYWESELPAFRARLLARASKGERAIVRGNSVPLMLESKAGDVLKDCFDKPKPPTWSKKM